MKSTYEKEWNNPLNYWKTLSQLEIPQTLK
jgi:hypothetical protein